MTDLTRHLIEAHGWDLLWVREVIDDSYYFEEFDVGFISLRDFGDFILLVAASVDDKHSLQMWRVIRNVLKTRTKPVITQYERNTEELFKASERYGVVRLQENIAYFGV